jgi:hypothetical protein
MPIKLSVPAVTGLACARPAPSGPAAYRRRWADRRCALMQLRILVIGCLAAFGAACTGGAYQTGIVVSGASFGEVLEIVRSEAPALGMKEDSTSAGFFRIEEASCRVVVVISPAADDVNIDVSQSCGPRWSTPKEFAAVAEQLRQQVEARFGKRRVRVVSQGFQPRV